METKSFSEALHAAHAHVDFNLHVKNAFAGEFQQELSEESTPIDKPDEYDIRVTRTLEQREALDREILDESPISGSPVHEGDRRKKWLKLPRYVRVAIRKLHDEFGHKR